MGSCKHSCWLLALQTCLRIAREEILGGNTASLSGVSLMVLTEYPRAANSNMTVSPEIPGGRMPFFCLCFHPWSQSDEERESGRRGGVGDATVSHLRKGHTVAIKHFCFGEFPAQTNLISYLLVVFVYAFPQAGPWQISSCEKHTHPFIRQSFWKCKLACYFLEMQSLELISIFALSQASPVPIYGGRNGCSEKLGNFYKVEQEASGREEAWLESLVCAHVLVPFILEAGARLLR